MHENSEKNIAPSEHHHSGGSCGSIDRCNPFMEFVNNNITKGFVWFLCALAIANAVVMLWENYGNKDKNKDK